MTSTNFCSACADQGRCGSVGTCMRSLQNAAPLSETGPPLNVDKMIVDELSELLNEPPAHLISRVKELAAATERLNAPVPEFKDWVLDGGRLAERINERGDTEFISGQKALDTIRDLGRRLAQMTLNAESQQASALLHQESGKAWRARAEAAERQLAEAVAKERWPKRTSCLRCGADWNNGQLDPEEYDRKVGIEAAAEVAEQEKLVRAALSGWLK